MNASAFSSRPKDYLDFQKSPGYRKINLPLRINWEDIMHHNKKNQRIECIIKTNQKLTEDQFAALDKSKFAIRAIIGTIITGTIIAKQLPQLANLEFITSIEGSVPVSPKAN